MCATLVIGGWPVLPAANWFDVLGLRERLAPMVSTTMKKPGVVRGSRVWPDTGIAGRERRKS
jgi:hypothetical protein